ncbi:hypothetical protein OG455_15395 [Kitasatospora sp. NBC_01287]|uniref:hypothetical protein n=1 Tax=Kitasatospora sp. NBC_01287 TaxID=2903573 RepID=UPI002251AD87|nr:hypothetical protein [Kitasatospora sp. NBC_01287]MCX4746890.1 hypothetical protein [Kitasatospora sp. NBC_01287]
MAGARTGAGAEVGPRGAAGLGADPVRELMAEHRELCERATHPLEIAALLEEAGLGSTAVGRYRHADVFSLAEELFARVPRRPSAGAPPPALGQDPSAPRSRWHRGRAGAALLGALLLPLVTVLGGPSGPSGQAAVGTAVALVLAAWAAGGAAERAARWVRHAGRIQLRTAGTLAQFRARMRPVLPVALGLHLAVLALTSLTALAVLTAVAPRPGRAGAGGLLDEVVQRAGPTQWVAQAALGLLIAVAAVLRRCGRAGAALVGLLAADGLGAGLSVLRSCGLLPTGWAAVPGALTALAAGAVAAVLLPYAWVALGHPRAHR